MICELRLITELFLCHSRYGMDLNGARRKNATRETTSTLKAWLNEHKKNPYPTKGEKIMLAIITKMTLTQVSTWFANARRRLKKENKMTWEPRNRVEDDDVNLDDDDHKSNDDKDLLDSKDSGTGSSEDGDRPSRLDMLDRPGNREWNGSRNDSEPNSPDPYDPRNGPPPHPLLHPHFPHLRPPIGTPPDSNHNTTTPSKPRIWSLADMANKESKDNDSPPASMYAGSSPGKIISPLARGFNPMHHPYMRPELYRSFYGAAAHHLSDPNNAAIFESYQRQLGATLAANGLPPSLMKSGPGGPFAPLSLTTNPAHHLPPRASSPASSTSSSPGARDPPNDKPTSLVTTASKP